MFLCNRICYRYYNFRRYPVNNKGIYPLVRFDVNRIRYRYYMFSITKTVKIRDTVNFYSFTKEAFACSTNAPRINNQNLKTYFALACLYFI